MTIETFRITALANALHYADLGWPVFPLSPRRKMPLYRNPHPGQPCTGRWGGCGRDGHGVLDATTDHQVITAWWQRTPTAGIGIGCGLTPAGDGPDVVDVDVKDGAPGKASVERLRAAGLLTGCWAQAVTPSGGRHLYFAGTRQGNGSIRGAGVDFRSAGGYVVGSPTPIWVESTGEIRVYRWLVEPDPGPAHADWAKIKDLLSPPRVYIRQPGVADDHSIRGLADWLRDQEKGGRNNALHWAACKALEGGHGEDGLATLGEVAREIGLDPREVDKSLRSARNRAMAGAV